MVAMLDGLLYFMKVLDVFLFFALALLLALDDSRGIVIAFCCLDVMVCIVGATRP